MQSDAKYVLRNQMKMQLRQMSCGARTAQSARIAGRIEQSPQFQQAEVVLLFCPMAGEVQIQPLFERWHSVKRLFLPVVEGDQMSIGEYSGIASLCNTNAFGIAEPEKHSCPPALDLAIVPGLAFDHRCHRLGRGKGFYDRFLSQNKTYAIGVCFDFQYLPHIPHDSHDAAMNEVICG